MNANTHLEQARQHLRMAQASPMTVGIARATSARGMIDTSLTFIAMAERELAAGQRDLAITGTPPTDFRRRAANG